MLSPITIILNTSVGIRRGLDTRVLAAAFSATGSEAVVLPSDPLGIYASARNALSAGSRVIVAAGGDGTASTVASALVGTDAALGVLPMGTHNHFAKDLRLPSDVTAAARVIVTGRATALDVGEVNGRFFLNNSGVGAYPWLVAERQQRQSRGRPKSLAAVMAAWSVWRGYRRLQVELTSAGLDRVVRTPFVFIGNNEYELDGMAFGGRRRLDEGMLHLCMAPDITRAGFAWMIAAALFRRVRDVEQFESLQLRTCTIQAPYRRLLVSLDGEIALLQTPLQYRIRPGALRVIVPANPAFGRA